MPSENKTHDLKLQKLSKAAYTTTYLIYNLYRAKTTGGIQYGAVVWRHGFACAILLVLSLLVMSTLTIQVYDREELLVLRDSCAESHSLRLNLIEEILRMTNLGTNLASDSHRGRWRGKRGSTLLRAGKRQFRPPLSNGGRN